MAYVTNPPGGMWYLCGAPEPHILYLVCPIAHWGHWIEPPLLLLGQEQVGHGYEGPGFVSMSPESRGRNAGDQSLPISEKKNVWGMLWWCEVCLESGP